MTVKNLRKQEDHIQVLEAAEKFANYHKIKKAQAGKTSLIDTIIRMSADFFETPPPQPTITPHMIAKWLRGSPEERQAVDQIQKLRQDLPDVKLPHIVTLKNLTPELTFSFHKNPTKPLSENERRTMIDMFKTKAIGLVQTSKTTKNPYITQILQRIMQKNAVQTEEHGETVNVEMEISPPGGTCIVQGVFKRLEGRIPVVLVRLDVISQTI